jgi:hypothetical protein
MSAQLIVHRDLVIQPEIRLGDVDAELGNHHRAICGALKIIGRRDVGQQEARLRRY